MIALHIAAILALSLVMSRAAKYIASAVSRISLGMRMSGFVVSFGLLGLATSMPEISVAVFSASRGTPELSLGNLLGANIVILTLLIGIAAIIAGKVGPGSFYRNHTLAYFIADVLLPVAMVTDGRLTRSDGLLLTFAHVAFLTHLYRVQMSKAPRTMLQRKGNTMYKAIFVGLAATGVLLVASYFIVTLALTVAKEVGVPEIIVGLLLFSIGTNLPELTFVLTESRRHKDVVVGDLFGSVLVNTPTLGLLALIHPFVIEQRTAVFASCAFLVLVAVVFGWFMWTKRALDRREGYWLVGLYGIFLAYYAWSMIG